ncbi:MAG: response regulator [Magnetococcales bacterium]|nr:response regulator [Magnetococcales bacterium]
MTDTPVKATILVVDDAPENLEVLKNILMPEYTLKGAINGPMALKIAQTQSPDLILLDVMMPGMDGYEVCRQLKQDERTREIPVIFVTAMTDAQDEVKGFEWGAIDYITKPISPPIVRARVQAQWESVLAHRQIQTLNQDLVQALVEQKLAFATLHQTRVVLAETQAVAKMTKAFEKFVPKPFLERIAKGGLENIRPGTVELSPLTMMFSDIRSFTNLSEHMPPHDLFAFLNSYIRRMQIPIEQQHGFIDKFIGDAIMALFDGPLAEQATHAVRAAIGMQEQLQEYNRERAAWGQEPIVIGIGLHSGPVMLGTLGNANRMDSTVIGDAASLAVRLEGLTKFYGCRIILSDEVFSLLAVGQFLCRPLDWVVLKGRRPVLIHELFDADPEPEKARKKLLQDAYRSGFALFRARRWRESQAAFQECLRRDANDCMAQMYWERCSLFMEQPPADDWDGAFEMLQK